MGAILVAVLLALSGVQCVASCAGDPCESQKNPPCHQSGHPQQSALSACPHELVVDRAANAGIAPAPAISDAAPAPAWQPVSFESHLFSAAPLLPPSLILRI